MCNYDTIRINTVGIISVHIRHKRGRPQPSFVNYNPTSASILRLLRLAANHSQIIHVS